MLTTVLVEKYFKIFPEALETSHIWIGDERRLFACDEFACDEFACDEFVCECFLNCFY